MWTGWRREATERKQEARRKLRDVLRPYAWQEWTRRHIEVPCTTKPAPGRVVYPVGRAALSPLSMRDEFILKRARALWSRSFKFTAGYKSQSGAGGAGLRETSCGTRSRAVIERTTF